MHLKYTYVQSYTKFIHHKCIGNSQHFLTNNISLFLRDVIFNIFCQCTYVVFFTNVFHCNALHYTVLANAADRVGTQHFLATY